MPVNSTAWTKQSVNSTAYTKQTVNSTIWGDDNLSEFYLLVQDGSGLLLQDGVNFVGLQT